MPLGCHSRWRQQRLSGRRRGWGRSVEIAVYGCIDTCSRKMLWAKVWVYLYKATTIASKLRLGKGSETGVMALMHSFNFSDSIMGTWIQWRQSCMGHQLPIKYMCTFLCDAVCFSHQSTWILTLNVCKNVLPFVLVIKNWNSIRTWWIPNLQGSLIYILLLGNYLNFLV